MTATLVGSYTVGECLPIALDAQASLQAQLPSIQAKVTGALAAQAAVVLQPPTLAADLTAALGLVAQLQAAIALDLPSVTLDLALMAAIVAELQAELGSLTAQLDRFVSLGAAGVHLIVQDGTLGTLGGDVGGAAAAIGRSDTATRAVVMVTTTPAAWAGLSACVKVS